MIVMQKNLQHLMKNMKKMFLTTNGLAKLDYNRNYDLIIIQATRQMNILVAIDQAIPLRQNRGVLSIQDLIKNGEPEFFKSWK